MKSGGNIPYTVDKNDWGHVFSTEEELVNRILDEKTIREKINYWKNNAKPGAAEYKDNGDVVNLFLGGNKAVIDWKKTSVSLNKKIKRWILSILFKQMRLKNKNN